MKQIPLLLALCAVALCGIAQPPNTYEKHVRFAIEQIDKAPRSITRDQATELYFDTAKKDTIFLSSTIEFPFSPLPFYGNWKQCVNKGAVRFNGEIYETAPLPLVTEDATLHKVIAGCILCILGIGVAFSREVGVPSSSIWVSLIVSITIGTLFALATEAPGTYDKSWLGKIATYICWIVVPWGGAVLCIKIFKRKH